MAALSLLLSPVLLLQLCHGVTAVPAFAPAAAPPPQLQQPLQGIKQPFDNAVLTPPPSPPLSAVTSGPRKLHGRFLHISDFHPDEYYKVHSSTSADHACHSGKGSAGTYGAETSDCDSPISLVNATFDWISANILDDIDFVIWTGDSARHDSDDLPRNADQVLATNRLLAHKFADTFSGPSGMTLPVIPTFGNNDILPHNVMLPGPNKWLSYYTDIWRPFIPEEQRHSFTFGGWFYVEVIPNKLAVFSLNTLYFFDRNAGVDDCTKTGEPGLKQLEWLRIQLQFMRDRGMKAILMGHVPPARTDSKTLWDESCWQKYTLWLKQYRDVVISGLYGHMNIDHFMLADTKDINLKLIGAKCKCGLEHEDEDEEEEEEVFIRGHLDDELTVQSATDYLWELRDGWSKLPRPEVTTNGEFESDMKKKNNKGKKDKKRKKLGGKWAERYQLALVSPSIVPNYFPTLRVFDYNITGLEDAVTWAEYTGEFPTVDEPDLVSVEAESEPDDLEEEQGDPKPELELRSLSDDVDAEKKKKKKKKPKKGKGKNPDLIVPDPPSKSSPPGPAYSPQPLTLVGYKQYFANLTYINNDIAPAEFEMERWREGMHSDKKPKSRKPNPREFAFEIEYTTQDDSIYRLNDLTVQSFVKLAYRMGKAAKGDKASEEEEEDEAVLLVDGDEHEEEIDAEASNELEDREDYDSDDDYDYDDDDDDDDAHDMDDEVDAEGKKKKKKGKKGKKRKKKALKPNKTWLHFLKHAFVSTVEEDELREMFS